MGGVRCRKEGPVYVVDSHIDVTRNNRFVSIRGAVRVDVAALRKVCEHYTALVPHAECCLKSKASRYLRDILAELQGIAERLEDRVETHMHTLSTEATYLRSTVEEYDSYFGPSKATPSQLHRKLQRLQEQNVELRRRTAQLETEGREIRDSAVRQITEATLHARASIAGCKDRVVLPPPPVLPNAAPAALDSRVGGGDTALLPNPAITALPSPPPQRQGAAAAAAAARAAAAGSEFVCHPVAAEAESEGVLLGLGHAGAGGGDGGGGSASSGGGMGMPGGGAGGAAGGSLLFPKRGVAAVGSLVAATQFRPAVAVPVGWVQREGRLPIPPVPSSDAISALRARNKVSLRDTAFRTVAGGVRVA